MYQVTGRVLYRLLGPIWRRKAKQVARVRIVLWHEGKVLLVKNWFGSGRWTLPGGGIKSHEKPVESAARELREELGLTLEPTEFTQLGRLDDSEINQYPVELMKIELQTDHVRPNRKEIVAVKWCDPKQLPAHTNPLVTVAAKR